MWNKSSYLTLLLFAHFIFLGNCLVSNLFMGLSDRIKLAVTEKFGQSGVQRVIECWDNFSAGKVFEEKLDEVGEVVQKADCYISGLSAICFHDMKNHPWALKIEPHYREILSEVEMYDKKMQLSNNHWLSARDSAGATYGPEWKTLGLQDRGVWEDSRLEDFPQTMKLLEKYETPSVEVFFAKQNAMSGIKPHSDRNNFIITCHIGLDVPEGNKAWIQVGRDKYYWKVIGFIPKLM